MSNEKLDCAKVKKIADFLTKTENPHNDYYYQRLDDDRFNFCCRILMIKSPHDTKVLELIY